MTRVRLASMSLATYPEPVADDAIRAAVGFASALDCALDVTTFSVEIPQVRSPLGTLLIDIPALVRAAEEKSRVQCRRLRGLVQDAATPGLALTPEGRRVTLGAVFDAAVAHARLADLALLPWSGDGVAARDMIESVVFDSGRPTIIVPAAARPTPLDHVAIAWDASRVAARALGDVLPLLAEGGRVSVLTVEDEKPLSGPGLAEALAEALAKRGYGAEPVAITLAGRPIAAALQESAVAAGARLLAMGGFGHSRLRDFVLGGATQGILADLRLPVLLSH